MTKVPSNVLDYDVCNGADKLDIGSAISTPGILGASGSCTVTVMTVFKAATKGFVVATTSGLKREGFGGYEGKILVTEEKKLKFMKFKP